MRGKASLRGGEYMGAGTRGRGGGGEGEAGRRALCSRRGSVGSATSPQLLGCGPRQKVVDGEVPVAMSHPVVVLRDEQIAAAGLCVQTVGGAPAQLCPVGLQPLRTALQVPPEAKRLGGTVQGQRGEVRQADALESLEAHLLDVHVHEAPDELRGRTVEGEER